MKYVVLFAVLLLVYLVWRAQRAGAREEQAAERPPVLQQEMVRCPVCAVHLPRSDALVDAGGRLYCSAEHRAQGGPRA